MLLGPLFTFDLIRLARRGLQPRLRAMLVAFLLLGLGILYIDLFPSHTPYEEMLGAAPALPRNAMSRFGESFMLLYLTVQLIAVILFTPVYAAGGIIEEKTRRTLEFLQASQLRSREIILGKFFARVVFVLSILLAGLPVLMLAAFFGGIEPERLLYGFTIAIVEAIFLGSFATMEAVRARTLGRVLLLTYMMLGMTTTAAMSCMVGGNVDLSVVSGLTTFETAVLHSGRGTDPAAYVAIFVGLHLLASLGFLNAAVKRLRGSMGELETPDRKTEPAIIQIAAADPLFHPRPFHDANIHAPPIGDRENPIVWKELHFTGRVVRKGTGMETLLMMLLVIAIYPILLYLFVALVKDINNDVCIGRTVNEVVKVFLELVLIAAPVIAGLRTSASIGTERQQDTLLALLTLPGERLEILRAKWWSAIRWLRGPLRIAAVVLVAGVVLLGVSPYAALCAGVLMTGFIAFTSSVGLLFSVYCSSVIRATLGLMLVWFAAMIGPVMVNATLGVSVSPPFELWDALEYTREPVISMYAPRVSNPRWYALLLGVGYAGLAWMCWRAAAKRFDREGKD